MSSINFLKGTVLLSGFLTGDGFEGVKAHCQTGFGFGFEIDTFFHMWYH
jgi:hypothetical protein